MVSNLREWKEYNDCCFKQKQALKKYILHCEQNNLCIYCESKITIDKKDSHFEHIKPKSLNIDKLTFDYNNIVVSCNGTTFNQSDDEKPYNCGHKKEAKYEKYKFLDPTKNKDIRLYFIYDYDDFKIYSSDKDSVKAEYMIDILQLNSSRLVNARKRIYKSFNKNKKYRKAKTVYKEKIRL
jgi:uncharacterized protein (TIGR02646 family)